MMGISVRCLCGISLERGEEFAGKHVERPRCGRSVLFPARRPQRAVSVSSPGDAAVGTGRADEDPGTHLVSVASPGNR
jgi:hypothetical protein